jgi:hypothetical protein
VAFAVVATAFVAQLVLVLRGGTDVNATDGAEPAGTGTRVVNLLSFFTIQSNLLVLAAAPLPRWPMVARPAPRRPALLRYLDRRIALG